MVLVRSKALTPVFLFSWYMLVRRAVMAPAAPDKEVLTAVKAATAPVFTLLGNNRAAPALNPYQPNHSVNAPLQMGFKAMAR